jgi:hypothetical protein
LPNAASLQDLYECGLTWQRSHLLQATGAPLLLCDLTGPNLLIYGESEGIFALYPIAIRESQTYRKRLSCEHTKACTRLRPLHLARNNTLSCTVSLALEHRFSEMKMCKRTHLWRTAERLDVTFNKVGPVLSISLTTSRHSNSSALKAVTDLIVLGA